MKAVIDTCILVDYLIGVKAAMQELGNYDDPLISRVTWIEIMYGAAGNRPERELMELAALFVANRNRIAWGTRPHRQLLTIRCDCQVIRLRVHGPGATVPNLLDRDPRVVVLSEGPDGTNHECEEHIGPETEAARHEQSPQHTRSLSWGNGRNLWRLR